MRLCQRKCWLLFSVMKRKKNTKMSKIVHSVIQQIAMDNGLWRTFLVWTCTTVEALRTVMASYQSPVIIVKMIKYLKIRSVPATSINSFGHLLVIPTRWSSDIMKRPGHKNFNAVFHNRSRHEVLFLNLTWPSRGQISSVLLQLLLFAFSNRKFGRHGKWSVTFWQWENNT